MDVLAVVVGDAVVQGDRGQVFHAGGNGQKLHRDGQPGARAAAKGIDPARQGLGAAASAQKSEGVGGRLAVHQEGVQHPFRADRRHRLPGNEGRRIGGEIEDGPLGEIQSARRIGGDGGTVGKGHLPARQVRLDAFCGLGAGHDVVDDGHQQKGAQRHGGDKHE